jgi:PPOX class probable F420-dependent enzyme
MVFDPAKPTHAAAEERLRTEPVIWLTSVRPDGQPQSSPVWFWWDGERLTVRSMPGAGKVRNIRSNPRVSLNLDGDRLGGEIVTLEGTAEIVDDDAVDPAYLAKYEAGVRSLGSRPEEFLAAYSTVLRIVPTRLRVY